MKKIDIHTHLTLYPDIVPKAYNSSHFSRFLNAQEQLAIHDKLNVEKGILLPIVDPVAQWMTMSNEEAYLITQQYPDRFSWFCNVSPEQGTVSMDTVWHIINHYKQLGAKGVGEVTTNMYADHPLMDNLFDCCAQLDMPVLIHIDHRLGGCYGIVDEIGLPRIEKMLKKHPDMKLIGHSWGFWREISQVTVRENGDIISEGKVVEGRIPELMREYENLYCDLSAGSGAGAMMRDPEYAAKFLEEFSDRVFYGMDVCSLTNTHPYEFDAFLTKMVNDGMLSVENYEKLICKNAIRILKL